MDNTAARNLFVPRPVRRGTFVSRAVDAAEAGISCLPRRKVNLDLRDTAAILFHAWPDRFVEELRGCDARNLRRTPDWRGSGAKSRSRYAPDRAPTLSMTPSRPRGDLDASEIELRTRRVLRMSSRGFASSTSRSARLPGASVPRSVSPTNSAARLVAARPLRTKSCRPPPSAQLPRHSRKCCLRARYRRGGGGGGGGGGGHHSGRRYRARRQHFRLCRAQGA